MPDIAVVCEGQTEKEFCRTVIAPHIWEANGIKLFGKLVGKPGRKRGGIGNWSVYRNELIRHGKERKDRYVSFLVDYYGMPISWPGRTDSAKQQPLDRGRFVEEKVKDDLAEQLGDRLVPCVQLHEFESLIFTDPELAALSIAMAGNLDPTTLETEIRKILTACGDHVEKIDDSPQTAPSKRLKALMPGYDKVAWGPTAANDITLPTMRDHCPWLHRWLTSLESLGNP